MSYQIYEDTKKLIGDYETRSIQIMDGLYFNQYQVIKTCEYYSNSQYLGGNKDELMRDKPFYNIVNYRVTLAKVATDLDIKDITIGSDDPKHYVHSMLLQKEGYEWMKKTNYGQALNKRGQTRPKYGGVLVKRVMKDDELYVETIDWRNVATDQVDIMGGTIVETHYMTPVELMRKSDVWANVIDVIQASEKQDTRYGSKFNGEEEQHNSERIIVREVTGQFPYTRLNEWEGIKDDKEDDYTYCLQHYFIADINGEGFVMYGEQMPEKDFPYKYLAWEEMPGRGLGRGVIEDAGEAQVWTNDAIINEKNAMDLAGKVVLKTDSTQVGANILEIDNGRIFELEVGKQLDVLNLEPSALGEFSNQIERWQNQANDATSSYDANSGKQPPSDTPYSQTALLNQVAAKPFDYRREEAGILETEIWEDWIIPHLIKKLYKGHLLASDFTDEELEVIDDAFATAAVNEKVMEAVLNKKIVSLEQYQEAITALKQTMKGKRRFLQIPDGFFDDIEAKITVLTTGEQKNKGAILQSLSTILGDVMKSYNPQDQSFAILNNPVMARIFGTILELSGAGISPASLGIGKPQSNQPVGGAPQPQAQAPAGQPQAPMQAPIAAGGAPSAMPAAPQPQ
jgi:hypothetical protein